MALTITDVATINSTTAEASRAVTGVTASIGDLLVFSIAADNAGASGASALSIPTDSGGNTWVQRSIVNNTPGSAANDGTTLGIWTSLLTVALSGGSVTANFSPDVTAKAALVQRYVSSSGIPPWVVEIGAGSSGNGASYGSGNVSVTSGDAIVAFVALENNNATNADSDTTNGSWSTRQTDAANGGSSVSSQSITSQHKIVNATGTQSYDSTIGAARDYALSYLVISDRPWPVAETLSGSDAETAVLALGAAETETLSGAATATSLATLLAAEGEMLVGSAAAASAAALQAARGEALSGSAAAALTIAMHPAMDEALGAEVWAQTPDGIVRAGVVSWPDTLPRPTLQGYRLQVAPNVVRTPAEFGAARMRRRDTRPLCRVEVTWFLTTWQQMLLEGFYRWAAEEGGVWLDIELAFPAGIRWVTARFAGQVQQQPLGANAWRTSTTLEVLQRPVIGEAELAAALGDDDDPSSPRWPSDSAILPRPTYDGYGLTDQGLLARTGDDLRGMPAQRRRSLDRVTDISCRWVLTGTQAATWDGFFVRRARDGARWFSMPVFGGIGLANAAARFTGEATWTPLGDDVWTVEAAMEVRERPIATEADLSLAVSTSEDEGPVFGAPPGGETEVLQDEDPVALAEAVDALDDLLNRTSLWGA